VSSLHFSETFGEEGTGDRLAAEGHCRSITSLSRSASQQPPSVNPSGSALV
jgi:hypothetical protein